MALASSRFSVAIHTLLVLARTDQGSVSSDYIANSVGTSPVLIRRLMGSLKKAHLIVSKAGPNGGFALARPASDISLENIYDAVAEMTLFPRHNKPNLDCPIGQRIGSALDYVYGKASESVRQSLKMITLAGLILADDIPSSIESAPIGGNYAVSVLGEGLSLR